MKLFIASDHAGFKLKRFLLSKFPHQFKGLEVIDLGPDQEDKTDNYPDFAHKLSAEVHKNPDSKGLLICATGLGMAIAANRHSGIRAVACSQRLEATLGRRHNNANVLCLGSKIVTQKRAWSLLRHFLKTDFEGGRHEARIKAIELK